MDICILGGHFAGNNGPIACSYRQLPKIPFIGSLEYAASCDYSEVLGMKRVRAMRLILVLLWASLLAVYIAAKVHFLTRFSSAAIGRYLEEHQIFWLGMAAVGFCIWLISRRFPEDQL